MKARRIGCLSETRCKLGVKRGVEGWLEVRQPHSRLCSRELFAASHQESKAVNYRVFFVRLRAPSMASGGDSVPPRARTERCARA